MSTKLLPCPFCGGEAELNDNYPTECIWCECKECGASSEGDLDRNKAIGEWNKRTPLIDCDSAEKYQGSCAGYQKSEYDDEPIEQCIRCDKYWGKEMFQDE